VVERRVQTFGAARLDTRPFPLVILEFAGKRVADADYVAALGAVEAILRSGEKSFLLTDASRLSEAPATQRKYAGEWTARTAELQSSHSLGGAVVVSSAFMRGVVTAIHWLKKPPAPTQVFTTRDEAIVYAVETIEAAGIPAGIEARGLASVARLALRK
jgi:hypothetical protein